MGSKIFWIFLIAVVLTASGLYFLNSNFKNLRIKFEKNTLKQASILFAFNIANSLSRAVWAVAFYKIGFKFALIGITCANMLVFGSLQWILPYEKVYLIYFVLAGAALGGCMVAFFNFTILVFG